MINHINAKFNPSFSAVVPIQVVFNNPQISLFDTNPSKADRFELSTDPLLSKKAAQAFVRILIKSEKAGDICELAENNMIRKLFGKDVKDYSVPADGEITSGDNDLVRISYDSYKNPRYLLTGEDAKNHAESGKNITKARVYEEELRQENIENGYNDEYDFEEHAYPKKDSAFVKRQKRNFQQNKNRTINNDSNRLKNANQQPLTLFIYADKIDRGKNATQVKFRAFDFKSPGNQPNKFI